MPKETIFLSFITQKHLKLSKAAFQSAFNVHNVFEDTDKEEMQNFNNL
jgi:hypothetical protein